MKKCPTTVHASKITFIAIAYTLVYACLWLLCSFDPDFIMTKFACIGLPELGNEELELSNKTIYHWLIRFCLLILYVKLIVYYQYLKLFWQAVPQEFARTTPGKAAGYSFIPFFHLYWLFHAWVGLLGDMNEFLNRNYKPTFAKGLMVFICVFWVCSELIDYIYWIGFFGGAEKNFDFTGSFSIAGIANLSILSIADFIITIFAIWYLRNKVMKFMSVCGCYGCEYGKGGCIQDTTSEYTQNTTIYVKPGLRLRLGESSQKTKYESPKKTTEKKCCIDWWQMPWFLVCLLGTILLVTIVLAFFIGLLDFLIIWAIKSKCPPHIIGIAFMLFAIRVIPALRDRFF
jgi:hypothetical protein